MHATEKCECKCKCSWDWHCKCNFSLALPEQGSNNLKSGYLRRKPLARGWTRWKPPLDNFTHLTGPSPVLSDSEVARAILLKTQGRAGVRARDCQDKGSAFFKASIWRQRWPTLANHWTFFLLLRRRGRRRTMFLPRGRRSPPKTSWSTPTAMCKGA